MVIETREIYQRDYLPIRFSYRHQIVLLRFYCFLLHDFPHHFTTSFISWIWSCWSMLGKKKIFFFSDRSSHMCFALEPVCRLLLTLRVNSGGLRWVEIACLMLWFLHFSKQPSLFGSSHKTTLIDRSHAGELSGEASLRFTIVWSTIYWIPQFSYLDSIWRK